MDRANLDDLGSSDYLSILDPKFRNLYRVFSKINQRAYKNKVLLANDVLAKIPVSGDFLKKYIEGGEAKKVTFWYAVKKIIFFYAKNFLWLLNYLAKLIAYYFSGQQCPLEKIKDKLVLIDIYFFVDKIIHEKDYTDFHFSGIEDVLKEKNIDYAYTPRFSAFLSPLKIYRALKLLKDNSRPVLTEFQLLQASDYCGLIGYLFTYPFSLVKLIKTLGNNREERFISYALWETMDRATASVYLRFFYGQRLSRLSADNIKCISWYENQPADKTFYLGLREVPGKIKIFGSQLFIWPFTYFTILPDEGEIGLNLVPDKVLVNGPIYLPKKSKINFQIGPSLRYGHIYKSHVRTDKAGDIVVLMPYWKNELNSLVTIVNDLSLRFKLKVKFHPATNILHYKKQFRGNVEIIEDELYECLGKCRVVIGQATGSLLEAACLGVPVIVVDSPSIFSHNYLPEFGRGIIWEKAENIKEIEELIDHYENSIRSDRDKVSKVGAEYVKSFFTEPTHDRIIEAFELDSFATNHF